MWIKVTLLHFPSGSGYRFAGLEYGTECHCGNRISAPQARSEDCNLNCRMERNSLCGGVARLSIYKVEEGLPGHRRCECARLSILYKVDFTCKQHYNYSPGKWETVKGIIKGSILYRFIHYIVDS